MHDNERRKLKRVALTLLLLLPGSFIVANHAFLAVPNALAQACVAYAIWVMAQAKNA